MSARVRGHDAILRTALMALSQRDVQRLLHSAVRCLAEALAVEYVQVCELLPDGKTLVSRAVVGREPRTLSRATVGGGQESLAAHCLLVGEPIVVRDLERETRLRPSRAHRRNGIVSAASVPLYGRSGAYGVLEVGSSTDRNLAEEQGVELLQAAGALLVAAIERARVEAACRFVAEFAGPLVSSLGLRDTLAALANLAAPRLADWCCIDLFRADGTLGEVAVAHVEPKKSTVLRTIRRALRPESDAALGIVNVIRTARPELHHDAGDCFSVGPARRDAVNALVRAAGFKRAIVVPLSARGHVIGVVTLVAAKPGRLFDEGDLILAEAFAALAGRVIDNVRLFGRRSGVPDLRSAEERSGIAMLDPMLLRTQLLAATAKETEHLTRVVDDVVYLCELDSDDRPIELGGTCDAAEVVRSVVAEAPYASLPRKWSLELGHTSTRVAGDASTVRRLVRCLIDNAVKYSPEDGSISVRLEAREADLQIAVRNGGAGIAAEERARVFERFYRGASARASGMNGAGVGLSICKELVDRLDGSIAIASGPESGTIVVVELPLAPGGSPDRRRGASA